MNWYCALALAVLALPAFAQNHELGLTLGRLLGRDRGSLEVGGGNAWQANYARRLVSSDGAALYVGVHLLANPLRQVDSTDPRSTTDVATLYVTPAVRLKFRPRRPAQPWVAVGGGYAMYEHSLKTRGGDANPAPRFDHTAVFMFGGGVDVPVWRWLGVRLEVRDFYSRNPVYNVPVDGRRQHNPVAGGGFALSF
jgi:hypothetical protein